MNKKVAILKSNLNSFEKFYSNILKKYVEVFDLYKPKNKIGAGFLYMHFKLNLPFKELWYGSWKNKLVNYNIVILFDSGASFEVINTLRKNNPNARLIFWNWNTGLPKEKVDLLKKLNYEVWSFDKKECLDYGFSYNNQFYEDIKIEENNIKYDLLFVGKDKNRLKILLQLKEKYFDKLNLSYKFVVRKTEKYKDKKLNKYLQYNSIEYKKLLVLISKSRCIIDLVKEGQEGITIRVLESVFYNKKLITNNKSIKSYDLYDSNNIFIIDEDTDFDNFMKKPYKKIDDKIMDKYRSETWIKNFNIKYN